MHGILQFLSGICSKTEVFEQLYFMLFQNFSFGEPSSACTSSLDLIFLFFQDGGAVFIYQRLAAVPASYGV
jgi:hypothetical protein